MNTDNQKGPMQYQELAAESMARLFTLHEHIVFLREIQNEKQHIQKQIDLLKQSRKRVPKRLQKSMDEMIVFEETCKDTIAELREWVIEPMLEYDETLNIESAKELVDSMIPKLDEMHEKLQENLLAKEAEKKKAKTFHKPKAKRNHSKVVKKPTYPEDITPNSSPLRFGITKNELQAHQENVEKETLKELQDLREESEQNLDLENETNEIDSI